jgi:hypothetical protein
MKSKYIINPGLAFAENSLIERLNRYAKKGWLLEKFTLAGFFLKLNKGTPTDEIYCMDIRKKVDPEYYKIFETAGWKHVSTGYDMYHFFQAPKGTTAIYTDSITAKEKNADIQKITGFGALISGVILFIAILLQFFTVNTIPFIALISMIIGFISLIVFIFCFMPWVAYRFRGSSK